MSRPWVKAGLAAVGAVAVAAAAIAFLARGDGDGHRPAASSVGITTTTTAGALTAEQQAEKAEAEAWNSEVNDALGGATLGTTIRNLVSTVTDWRNGKATTDDLNNELGIRLDQLVKVR